MIYYTIIFSGILLLLLTNLKWIKIKKSIINTKKTSIKKTEKKYFLILSYRKIYIEWMQYLHNIVKDKNKPHIFIPIAYAILIYTINFFTLKLNVAIIFIFISVSIIYLQITLSRKRHYSLFKKDFPEVLLMINMASSSGASINHILERCGQEVSGPLGNELILICRRLNLGESPETVFYDAYQRFNYPEFYFLTMIILLNIQQGGQLRELTSRLSQVISKNKTTEQKKSVLTAQTRMSVNIISAMPFVFSFLLYFIDSSSIESIWDHSTGRIIFYYIIISEAIGIFIIRKMLRKTL
ncbi:type II secretion system F family protein [Yersinia alsatica]|uniref:type II secretion system F family protein n=1 Tax=Yersinia alsatica TaxID=2890317 RepID=UPI0011A4CCFE|nr:type II secretion system F family protein [Yersinia alsatica]